MSSLIQTLLYSKDISGEGFEQKNNDLLSMAFSCRFFSATFLIPWEFLLMSTRKYSCDLKTDGKKTERVFVNPKCLCNMCFTQ